MHFTRLFLAEKPSLAQGIAEALADIHRVRAIKGDGAWEVASDRVSWLFGHMYETAEPGELDPRWARWSLESLPIVVPETAWKLTPHNKHAAHLKKIRALIKGAKLLVHCGDAAREGQLLVDEVILGSGANSFASNVQRLWVQSMARKDMIEALNALRPNADRRPLYDSALCRQRADFQHGMTWTRFMTVKAKHGGYDVVLSVGRVQTPTLRLVVDRDREREAFVVTDHFLPRIVFEHKNGSFAASWIIPADHPGLDLEGRLVDRRIADQVLANVAGKQGRISLYKSELKAKAPPLPFNLSALQAACSSQFHMTAAETLETAQSLYETHKVTTYPRSDSRYLPLAILKDEAPAIINNLRQIAILGDSGRHIDLARKSSAWDDTKVSDHHAIIPTTELTAAKLARMNDREREVCLLIARSFVAQFLPNMRWRSITAEVLCAGYEFRAVGREMIDAGWRQAYGADHEEEDPSSEEQQAIPEMQKDDTVQARGGEVQSKHTSPPSAFTDGTLITAMANIHRFVTDPEAKKRLRENAGIGTEATRAAILSTLLDRGFLKRKGKTGLISTELGRSLIDALPDELKDPVLTARWESALEDVERGRRTRDEFMSVQARYLTEAVARFKTSPIVIQGAKRKLEQAEGSGQACPKCAKGTLVTVQVKKEGPSKGKLFLACTRYPDCDYRQWPGSNKPPQGPPLEGDGESCGKCHKGVMRSWTVKKEGPNKGKRFLACSDRECKNMVWPNERTPSTRTRRPDRDADNARRSRV